MRSNLTTTRLILIFVVAMVTFPTTLVAQTFQPSKNGSSFADMPETFPGQIFSQHKPLKIGPVTSSADQVSRYEKLELTVELDATYENPFDPAEVRLDAIFTSPSGQEQIVPGFFLVEHRREVHTGSEVLLPEGHGAWKIRFAPRETGRYSWRLSLRDRSGEITGGPGVFQALPADRPGFVRVSRADPHYFAFDNGQGYFPIGHNLPNYLDKLNLYFHFTALANFTGDLPLGTARWEPLSTTTPQFVDQSRPPETRDVVLLPSNRWGKAEHDEFVIQGDGTIAGFRSSCCTAAAIPI